MEMATMKFRITSDFGAMEQIRDHAHTGKDFAIPEGEPLYSFVNGVVDKVADFGDKLTGKTVFLNVGDGKQMVFGHLKDISVKKGEIVSVGDMIGHSGNTGFSTGAHLHFAVKQNGAWVDPSAYDTMIQHINEKKTAIFGLPTDSQFKEWFGSIVKDGDPAVKKLFDNIPDTSMWDVMVQKAMAGIGHGLHNWFDHLYSATYGALPEIAWALTFVFGVLVMGSGNFVKWGSRYLTFLFALIIWKVAG